MARVGVAVCDPAGILATPLRTLKRDVKKNSDIYALVKLAFELGAVQIFLGLPRALSGRDTASTSMAREYTELLVAALAAAGNPVDVRFIDERLTTVSAHRSLHEAGLAGRKHRQVVDQVAAADILQQALDMQKSLQRNVGDPA